MMNYPQIICYSRGDKIPEEYVKINTTSRSSEECNRKLSPFFLGPIDVQPFDKKIKVNIFENAWQFSKQYEQFSNIEDYLRWSTKGFEDKKAIRFPMGRGAKPMYS